MGNWTVGQSGRKNTEQKEKGREIKAKECKRIEESNRHSNYRRRNEELMAENGEKENKRRGRWK